MTITIPTLIFTHLIPAYLLIGLALFAPLNHWYAHFISPRRRGLEVWKPWPGWIRFAKALLSTLALWPTFLWECVRSEWRHGLGERWRFKRCGGCCSTCHGTGISNEPETNGRCWDCYGTGHVHP